MSVGFVNYDGMLDADGFDKFVSEFNAVKDNCDKICIFLTTNGGDISIVHNLYNLIILCEKPIDICISEECSSGGFILLAMLKGKVNIRISSSAWAVIHLVDTYTTINEFRKTPEKYAMFKERQDMMCSELITLFRGLNFLDEELEDIKECKDLYVDGLKLKGILGV